MAFLRNELPVFLPSLCLSTQFGCNLSEASRWSPVLQQMARLKMNETQLKVSPYTFVPGNGCWRRQFRSFQEQSITGKADGLVLLRAETLPHIVRYNCTSPHKMVMTSNHFSRALPFLMIISFLTEHWVCTAKNIHSLLEWTWCSPIFCGFCISIIQFSTVLP